LASANRRRLREAANRGCVTRDITENAGVSLVEVRKLATWGRFDRLLSVLPSYKEYPNRELQTADETTRVSSRRSGGPMREQPPSQRALAARLRNLADEPWYRRPRLRRGVAAGRRRE
jgi:hypothetical protein